MTTPKKSMAPKMSMAPSTPTKTATRPTPTKGSRSPQSKLAAARAAPSTPLKTGKPETKQLRFRKVARSDCFWNQNAYKMSAVDINACKLKCVEMRYGSFVVFKGTAFFRSQSVQECRKNIFSFRASDVYLNLTQRKKALPRGSLAFAKRALARLSTTPSKRRRSSIPSWAQGNELRRAQAPISKPWPVRELRAYDFPFELGWGKLIEDVLKERGWNISKSPCHATYSEDDDTAPLVFVKEFAASLAREKPEEIFGKKASKEEGYSLQKLPLPDHALFLMGRTFYRVPGTNGGRAMYRDDMVQTVVEYGKDLNKENPGNYRVGKFPGTETACFKTNLTDAFRGKPWYPTTYILPKEKDTLMRELKAAGDSQSYWIAKPRNDYGGTGIGVWKSNDADLVKLVADSDSQPRSVVQSYLHDPLLIGGYKFHMRIHLIVTSLDPPEAYIQENGQCLFATKPYTLAAKTLGATFDPPAHVTNMGLNATPANKENYFTKKPVVGKGQQIRMKQLEAHLAKNHSMYDKQALWSQILQIGKETTQYFAKAPAIKQHGKLVPDRHYELFGMDLMLDKKLNVYMCEVNTDPGLSYPDELVLNSPNPDYKKEAKACTETIHDVFALLGLDAGKTQPNGSLKSWFKLDFDN